MLPENVEGLEALMTRLLVAVLVGRFSISAVLSPDKAPRGMSLLEVEEPESLSVALLLGAKVKGPAVVPPKADSLPKVTVPLLRVTPPLSVLAALSKILPARVNGCALLMVPLTVRGVGERLVHV